MAKPKKLSANNGSIYLLLCWSVKVPYIVLLSLAFFFLIYMNYASRLIIDLTNRDSTSLPWQHALTPARKKEKAISYKDTIKEYVPASCEKYIVEHAEKLGYASTKVWTTEEDVPSGVIPRFPMRKSTIVFIYICRILINTTMQ